MKRRRQSSAKRSPDAAARPGSVFVVRPRFRIVSIIPGIEERAPERTETSSGSFGSPKRLPGRLLDARERRVHLRASRRRAPAPRPYSAQTAVSIVNPGGTGMPERRHLREARALAAERLLAEPRALRHAVAEEIDLLFTFSTTISEKSASRENSF